MNAFMRLRSALKFSGTLRTRCLKAKSGIHTKWPSKRSIASNSEAGRSAHSYESRQTTVCPSTNGITAQAISPISSCSGSHETMLSVSVMPSWRA
jgi:hypothetical protein